MKVKIFTEASPMIGFGHAVRCSSLYQELKGRDVQAEFIVNGESSIQGILPNVTMTFADWLNESYLLEHLKDADYAIIDSYLASSEIYQLISERTRRALYIDDYQRIRYPKGVILNPVSGEENFEYCKDNDEIEVLTGWEYILLRPEFIEYETDETEEENAVLLLSGGTDALNIASNMARLLSEYNPSWHINVVGNGRSHGMESLKNATFHGPLTARELKRLMLHSKYIISAAGQTLFELLYLNKVFLPLVVIENQKNNIEVLHNIFPEMLSVDVRTYLSPIQEIINVLPVFLSAKYREEFNRILDPLVDGLGAKRVIEHLFLVDDKR